jgi:metallophosphoesterase (TIGR00282 family)
MDCPLPTAYYRMRILFIGDVIAKPGRRAVAELLPALRAGMALDLVIANGENSAGGSGITAATAGHLFAAGVDVLTTGNHVWHQREALDYLPTTDRVLRPLNFPAGAPGVGATVLEVAGVPVLVANALGRIYLDSLDNPFHAIDELLGAQGHEMRVVVIDFHAEATSEKRAFGFHLDGRASLVVGTHTHVPTADAQVLPGGTAYVTDVGMVGPRHSVIGVEIEPIVRRFLSGLPQRFDTARDPEIQFNAVLANVDETTGRARSLERLDRIVTLHDE